MNRVRKSVSGALVVATLCWTTGCSTLRKFSAPSWFGSEAQATTEASVEAELARGRGLEEAGNWDKAAAVYEELAVREPNNWQVAHRQGVVADNQKRFTRAQERYARAIQLNPRNGELFSDLGFCFYLQGKLDKAESALQKSIQLEPNKPRFHNNLGMVVGQQGRMDEAFEQFAMAGSEADALYNVAFIYASNNNDEAAMQCFQMALESDPTHEKARNAIESFARNAHDDSFEPTSGHMVRYEEDAQQAISNTSFEATIPNNRQAGAATRQLRTPSRGHGSSARAGHGNSAQMQAVNAGQPVLP